MIYRFLCQLQSPFKVLQLSDRDENNEVGGPNPNLIFTREDMKKTNISMVTAVI